MSPLTLALSFVHSETKLTEEIVETVCIPREQETSSIERVPLLGIWYLVLKRRENVRVRTQDLGRRLGVEGFEILPTAMSAQVKTVQLLETITGTVQRIPM